MPQITIKDAFGADQVVAATANTGQTTSANSLPVVLASDQTSVNVTPANITTKFRESFEALLPSRWTISTGTGDIVRVDGNAGSASYLVISKSPWDAGNETTLETVETFTMPVEIAFGAHRSQATLGQEFSFEYVDTGTPLSNVADLVITSITQSTTTLTVDTATPHGLVPGKPIGIRDCSNQLANYPALVVAAIPSPTQFTATAGPGGTIPSLTITNPTGDKGFVFFRERLGRANDGVSQIFENTTVTNSSLYVRSEQGDALPSGTINGNHAVAVGTTASVQLINTPYTYAFAPTTEFRMAIQADRIQWHDSPVDSLTQTTSRLLRTQVCSDPSASYRFRIRANNSKSLTVINAKVISATKTGTTTGTLVTDRPHGLITGDLIVYYGNSNVAATAFPNLTTATAVTVVNPTTFTVVIGTAASVVGYGGIIAKVHGGNLPSTLGWINNSAVNATLSTLAGGTRQLVLTGAAAWSGLVIGDYVNVEGVSNTVNGNLLGVDGVWVVANSVTTALTLVPATTAFAATLPVDFGLTASAGAVVKRTDLRTSFVRIFDYERERVEVLSRPTGDLSAAIPVVAQGGTVAISTLPTLATVTTVATVSALTGGGVAEDAAAGANPVMVGGVARTAAAPATLIAGDAVRDTMTVAGAKTIAIGAPVVGAEVASAARTATGNSGVISVPTGGSISGTLTVTAVSGTTPTLDLTLEESYDNGVSFVPVWAAPRVTANTTIQIPAMLISGLRRWVWTIGGTTPSFTFAINVNQLNIVAPIVRQFYDRTANVLSGVITTPTQSILISGCKEVTVKLAIGAATTGGTYQLQISDDNINWSNVGTATVAIANTVTSFFLPVGLTANWARVIVTSAATGQTGTYVALNATN